MQERRRRWGSSTSHTPTASQPPISSDTLEVTYDVIMMSWYIFIDYNTRGSKGGSDGEFINKYGSYGGNETG